MLSGDRFDYFYFSKSGQDKEDLLPGWSNV